MSTIPTTDLVDWVLVQLLSRYNGSVEYVFEVEAQTAAFLKNNGDIKALNGTSSLFFNNLDATNLYLRVYSRNHLPLISPAPLTGNNNIFLYDFSIGPDKNIGGINVQRELSPGWWGVRSGDGNADFQTDNTDKNDVWLPEKDLSGYYRGDFNMNSVVDYDDIILNWEQNAGRGLTAVKDTLTGSMKHLPY